MKTKARIHDPWLFLIGIVTTIVGLFCVFDAGYARSIQADRGVLSREFLGQIIPFALGIWMCVWMSKVDADVLRRRAPIIWLLTLVALTLPFMPVVGLEMNGASRWIRIWKLPAVHPAEFAKVAVVIYLAAVFANRKSFVVRKTRDFVDWVDAVALKKAIRLVPAFLVLIGVVLVEKEPDLGTAAVVGATAFALFIVGGASRWSLAAGLAGAILGGYMMVKMEPYRMERFRHHFARWEEKQVDDTGYQTVQSEMAMASGGLIGVGPGSGRAKHVLPAATTDFVTATIGEEFGLWGSVGVLGLVGLMVLRMLQLAAKMEDRFRALLLYGFASWIGIQASVNVLMATGLWPAIGIPLPFISSGGSSLAAHWIAIGVCQSAVAKKQHSEVQSEASGHGRRDRRSRVPGARSRPIRA